LNRENKLFGVIPRIQFEDKSTYTESHTKEYDMVRCLLYIHMIPVVCLSVLSKVASVIMHCVTDISAI